MAWGGELDRAAARDLDELDRQASRRIRAVLHGRVAALDGSRGVDEALKGSRLGECWK